jgi:hypothetical protein
MDTIRSLFESEIVYEFPNCNPLTICSYLTPREKPLFLFAKKHGLKMYRFQSLGKTEKIYRLSLGNEFADFILLDDRVKLLAFEGNEDFLNNKFAKVVFEAGANRIFGAAHDSNSTVWPTENFSASCGSRMTNAQMSKSGLPSGMAARGCESEG